MREWNAETYHRVSDPQLRWGLSVLARLPLRGDERVLDVGCGTGRLTGKLLECLPSGSAVAIDLSANMLGVARNHLAGRFGARVRFVRANAAALPVAGGADAIFSTATFHWALDHPALFRSLYAALTPGGRLVAQCGGGANIRRVRDRCDALMRDPAFAPYYQAWQDPWEFADAETTEWRLRDAGFVDVRTSLEATPVVHPDAATYRTFVANVICGPHLACLPDESFRDRFMDAMTADAARDAPAFELDYWRLNMDARKPGPG